MNKTNNSGTKYEATLFRLFLGFSIFQFLLHLFYLLSAKDPRVLMPTSIAFVHDLLILSLFYFIAFYIVKYLPSKIKIIGEKACITGFIIIVALLSLYPRMLREYLVFPVNIFESDASVAKTLIVDYLGFSSFLPLAFVLIIGIILVFFVKKEFKVSPKLKTIIFILIILTSLFFLQRPSPQPVVYSIQMQVENFINNEQRIVPSLLVSEKENFGLISPLTYPEKDIKDYDHVALIILEEVTAKDFEKEFITLPNGFYEQNKNTAVYYQNYYANNLDSYTSLIAIMTSIQVPYRSYADDELYDRVNQESNLVDYFNKESFKSLFVSTFEYHPFIPSRTFWNDIYIRKDFDNIDEYKSIGSSRMEMATEDKAAIDAMVKYMKENKKSFVLHELAYGHSPEWRATIGTTQLDYYNDYLVEFSEKLKQENILEKSLFIVVSDHGERTKVAEMENYRVPLLFVGKTLKQENNTLFLSHLDLPSIIFSALGVDNKTINADQIYTVGSSEKWTYGKITSNKDFLFINDVKGTVLSQTEGMKTEKIQDGFQKYVNEFNLKYGRK